MFSKHIYKQLSAYCNGELDQARSRDVAEHLLKCGRCRSQYDEIKLGVSLAERLPQVKAPDSLWSEIESRLDNRPVGYVPRTPRPFSAFGWQRLAGAGALAALVLAVAAAWYYARLWGAEPEMVNIDPPELILPGLPAEQIAPGELPAGPLIGSHKKNGPDAPGHPTARPSWEVARLEGIPKIGSEALEQTGRLAVGEWLETDAASRARINVADIGHVEVEPNSRIRLVRTESTEHRLALARGRMSAQIFAPPRLFFVDTPSAVAVDYGCAYTLEVDKAGAAHLRVTAGWVALVAAGRESMVPAGATCVTRPGLGPGTPYFEDASEGIKNALTKFDFQSGGVAALDAVLLGARARDTLTLWHLLARVDRSYRERVYDQMARLVPPPEGVTRAGVLALDQNMLEQWMRQMTWSW